MLLTCVTRTAYCHHSCECETGVTRRHTWTWRNKLPNLISTLLQSVAPPPCVLSWPDWTDWPPLLYLIWLWPSVHLEVEGYNSRVQASGARYYTDFSTRASSQAAGCKFRTSRHRQASTSCHHLSGNYPNHGWIMPCRYFSYASSCATSGSMAFTWDWNSKKDIIQFILIWNKGGAGSKNVSFASVRPRHVLFMCLLPWPTFRCGVTFDVEGLIERKNKVNLSISKCVYNKALKIGPALVWHLCHVGHIDLLKRAERQRRFKQVHKHTETHGNICSYFISQKEINMWFWSKLWWN